MVRVVSLTVGDPGKFSSPNTPIVRVNYQSVSVLQEEAIPELEIDVDELLDMQNDDDRAARVRV